MVILILNNPTNYYFFTQFTQLHPREIWEGEGLRCEKNDAAAQGQGPESGSKPKPIYPPPEFSTCHTPATLSHAHFSACINIHFFYLQVTTDARVVPRTLSLSSFRKENTKNSHQRLLRRALRSTVISGPTNSTRSSFGILFSITDSLHFVSI